MHARRFRQWLLTFLPHPQQLTASPCFGYITVCKCPNLYVSGGLECFRCVCLHMQSGIIASHGGLCQTTWMPAQLSSCSCSIPTDPERKVERWITTEQVQCPLPGCYSIHICFFPLLLPTDSLKSWIPSYSPTVQYAFAVWSTTMGEASPWLIEHKDGWNLASTLRCSQ